MNMLHTTKFEDMNQVQRSLHNMICILDDECLQTYEASLSEAIDQITELNSKLALIVDASEDVTTVLFGYNEEIDTLSEAIDKVRRSK